MSETTNTTLLTLTAQIVSAHLSTNPVSAEALPALIQQTYQALSGLGSAGGSASAAEGQPTPAVPIKRSVFPDYVICLEDGKKLKIMKRYLSTAYNMTPEQYRKRWGLPADYPMVAPNYAAQRAGLARKIGLGRKNAEAETPPAPETKPTRRRRPKAV